MNMGEIKLSQSNYISLDLKEDLEYEEWVEIGEALTNQAKHIMWWLGDWWNYGDRKYGELASQALDFGIPYSTFSNASYVAKKIPVERRVPELSWTHHFEVAYIDDTKEIDKLLKEAYEKKYSVRDLRSVVKKNKITKLNSEDKDFNIVDRAGVNIKTSNVWSFGQSDIAYGVDNLQKTPPQMIANLIYWFSEPGTRKIVDITDKYQVTYDLASKLNFEVASFDLYPAAGTSKVQEIDLSVEAYPKEVKEADFIIFNVLDFLDNPMDLDEDMFIRQQIISLGVCMKKGARLMLISKDLEKLKIENIFSLIYEENDFSILEFISINNKNKFSKDEEAQAIKDKMLLNKFGYVLVLESQSH